MVLSMVYKTLYSQSAGFLDLFHSFQSFLKRHTVVGCMKVEDANLLSVQGAQGSME